MNVLCFQCCDDISYYDNTLHLLCHYAGNMKLEKARTEVLTDFLHVPQNYEWFGKVTKNLLCKKGTTLSDYIVSMLSGKVPLDEAGILLFARATGLHFGVYYSDSYWCTNADRDPTKWEAMFLYGGNLKFFDTQPGAMDSDDCNDILNLDATGQPRGRSKKAVRTTPTTKKSRKRHLFDNGDNPDDEDYDPKTENTQRRKRRVASNKGAVPLAATSVALTAMKQAKATVKPKRPTKDAAIVPLLQHNYEPWARRTRAGKKLIPAAAGSATSVIESDNEVVIEAPGVKSDKSDETETSNPQACAKSTNTSEKSIEEESAKSTNTGEKSIEEESAKSTNTPEKSNGDETETSNPQASAKSTGKYNEPESAKSTDESDKSIDKNNQIGGVLQVQVHGLKKSVAKERSHKCVHCPQVFKHVKDLNEHNKTDHPDKPFECSTCQKKYSSTNALARHEKRHEGFGFKCGQCSFVCQFRYELRDHLKKHSDSQKWPCERGGCGLQFSTKRGMRQHMQVHSDTKYPCTYCPKVFDTPGYLRQHTYYHTGGFPCYCGQKEKNPTARNIHQKNCDACKDNKKIKVLLGDFKERSTLDELNQSTSSSSEASSSSSTEEA